MAAQPLDNDPANPCIGCGPHHPFGLRLRFAREGAQVLGELKVTEHLVGWPERLHSGVLYLALQETANWAHYGLTGRAGYPLTTSALDLRARVPVGAVLRLVGRLADEGGRVRAEAWQGGALVAALDRTYVPLDEATLRERLGYVKVPHVLDDLLA